MRRTVTWLAVLSTILVGYVAAGPFITIHQIKSAIERQDSEVLASNVDFPLLRDNLKEQLNALVLRGAASDAKDNMFGALGMLIASKFVETFVDSVVTPTGLASLMAGKRPQPPGRDQACKFGASDHTLRTY